MFKFLWKMIKWSVIGIVVAVIAVMIFVDLPEKTSAEIAEKNVQVELIDTTLTEEKIASQVAQNIADQALADKYSKCYSNMTAAHKASGLHDSNRDKSIEIKVEMCNIASTSTTGEGSDWIK